MRNLNCLKAKVYQGGVVSDEEQKTLKDQQKLAYTFLGSVVN